jgi:hypothetical protein
MKRIAYPLILLILAASCADRPDNPETINAAPDIFPDYTGVTVPATIAPLNFRTEGRCKTLHVLVEGSVQGAFEFTSHSRMASFPAGKWKKLLAANIGGAVNITLTVKTEDNRLLKYLPFPVYISPHTVDYGLAYRLIAPGYEVYGKMGIYERSLSDYSQKAVIENTLIQGSCVNCHSFNQTRTDSMSLHVRGALAGTIITGTNGMKALDTRADGDLIAACVYPYWHPSGRYIAYSVNKTRQGFHAVKEKQIEVLDLASDIVIYDVENNELFTDTILSSSALETFPSFSPDGSTLYFCKASEAPLPSGYKNIQYSLCSIAFDPARKQFGSRIDTLLNAGTEGYSVSFPKPSYDGRYIMFTMLYYGNFGAWHQEADLYMLDLNDRSARPITEVNSPYSESYHSWSSNSRWFAFGSRRLDGLYTRPYIASVDDNGAIGKPFLLPLRNPGDYGASLLSYNALEFISSPVKLNASLAEYMLKKREREPVRLSKR